MIKPDIELYINKNLSMEPYLSHIILSTVNPCLVVIELERACDMCIEQYYHYQSISFDYFLCKKEIHSDY